MTRILRNLLTLATLLLAATLVHAQTWQLVWQDEFSGAIGPDWVFETGNGAGGWGNNELEYYRRENASVENGSLVITARREDFGGMRYTSARMKTQGRRDFLHGRIEARIAMPSALGLWPAFWMLGSNIDQVGWPASGEIDVMEHINTETIVHGTAHWKAADGTHASNGGSATASVTGYHVYAVEWDPQAIKWFVDGQLFHILNIANGPAATGAFQKEFFLLLNLAVGGNWPGFVVNEAALPARLLVDYVRVYQDVSTPLTAWANENATTKYIRHKKSRGRVDAEVTPYQDGNWKMVAGLVGSGVSFESQSQPGRYLRRRATEVWLEVDDGTQLFKEDATFLQRPGLADATASSFEAYASPGSYLRQRKALLYVEPVGTGPSARRDATFRAAAPLQPFVSHLEAEAYAVMQGMVPEACSEGGQNLGYIDPGDWAVWNVNLPRAGRYTVEYRIASLSGGGQLQLEQAGGGQVYGSVVVPGTGGWQNWATISHQVQLQAGQQQIAIKALAGGWNINWLRISAQ
jgi:beta-glucanase (GH16 family)